MRHLVSISVVLCLGSITASAQISYRLTVVPPLAGTTYLNFKAVNAAGHAVGLSGGGTLTGTSPYHAVFWSTTGGLVDLGIWPGGTGSSAYGMNDNDEVVGGADAAGDVDSNAVYWDSSRQIHRLYDMLSDADKAHWVRLHVAGSINNSRQVTGGGWLDANMTAHAFLMDLNFSPPTIIDLGVLPPNTQSQGYIINNASPPQVVGICNYSGNSQGYLYQNGVLSSLLPIVNCQQINDSSWACGWSSTGSAYRKPDGTIVNLGGGGGFWALNNAASPTMLGHTTLKVKGGFKDTVVRWQAATGFIDLNTLISNLPKGYAVSTVPGVSNAGVIVGWGTGGGWVLTPQ